MTRHLCNCYGSCDHASGFCDRDVVEVAGNHSTDDRCDYCIVMAMPSQRTPRVPVLSS